MGSFELGPNRGKLLDEGGRTPYIEARVEVYWKERLKAGRS